ncbi:MAG TPA: lipid-A-disaccharide synthase N-terminal domain-containing protein [Thermoanaerobaculia bacterium]|nr:lipid-A-disaccharide synthase N-terminal domain-containing protein [Thermoanaerobaculia bacterium]
MTLDPTQWDFWVAFGFLGQASFSARFLVQWVWSEKRRESVVPVVFWYFSLLGGLILTIYAIHRRDPVFIVGQGFGLLVYTRNLVLIRRAHKGAAHEG